MLDDPAHSDGSMLVGIARNLLVVAREKVLAQAFIVKAQHGLKRSEAYIDFVVDLERLIARLDLMPERPLMTLIEILGPVDDDDDEALWSLVESRVSLEQLLFPA